MQNSDILFYTSAIGHYAAFVPLYAYFGHVSNPGASFEFIVDDIAAVERHYAASLTFLRMTLGVKIALRDVGEKLPVSPNTLRFILPPTEKAKFVYIGDIDIILLEGVADRHSPIFDDGLPYSNMIRNYEKRLTGLHFTRYDAYYPLPKIDDILVSTKNDEEILYKIVERAGHIGRQPEINAKKISRPLHGIHMSLNRIPFSDRDIKVDWGMTWEDAQNAAQFMTGEIYENFEALLPSSSRLFLANIYVLQKGILAMGKERFETLTTGVRPKDPTKELFTNIFNTNAWQGSDSRSGPSSNMERTRSLREALPGIIQKYGIKTFLDAPCGDFFWMKTIAPQLPIQYIGADIVDEMITENRAKYPGSNLSFVHLDLTKGPIPSADVLFCRDCLFHLSYQDIAKVFRNFMASECQYFMTTSHNSGTFENKDIKTGGWRQFDLFKPPFNFPQSFVEAVTDGGGDRKMYMWRKESIAHAIAGYGRLMELQHA